MRLVIPNDNPSIVRLYDFEDKLDSVKSSLTYTDKAAVFAYNKFKKATWALNKLGPEKYGQQLSELKLAQKKCILFKDDTSTYTYSGLAGYLSKKLRIPVDNQVDYPSPKALPWAKAPSFEPYEYQLASKEKLLEAKHAGVQLGCHRKGELVLMFDGSFKTVESIQVGDQLMGPDSTARTVQELKSGFDSMFKIETVNGQTMFVNGNHILALERTKRANTAGRRSDYRGTNPRINITVNDYLKKSKTFKHLYKLFTAPVKFRAKDVSIDPYLMGVLLGDGSLINTPNITTMDPEIIEFIQQIAVELDLNVVQHSKSNNKALTYALTRKAGSPQENILTTKLKALGLWDKLGKDKFIPDEFKINSNEVQAQVLAGLLDTDGSYIGGCFDYISKSEQLASDVAFLGRSLGLRVSGPVSCQKYDQNGTQGTYFRLTVSGNVEIIPTKIARKKAKPRLQKKSPNQFGFSVTKVSDSEQHYGFELDKDHLYLTDTFLVTHNTGLGKSHIILLLVKALGLKTIIMTPATSISDQLYENFVTAFGKKYVGKFFDGKKEANKLITVGNAQSFTRVEPGSDAWNELSKTAVFIADESHQCPATTLESVCFGLAARAPYRFFFSATQMRNDGKDLLLDAITGPIVYTKSVREGVDEGYLSKPLFRMVNTDSDVAFSSQDVNAMTRKHLYYNEKVTAHIGKLVNASVAAGNPTVVLIEEVEQFTKLLPYLRHAVGFAHGPLSENKEKVPPEYWESDPTALVKDFNALKLPILVGTSCITTGTDIKAVKTLVYWQGGKSEIQVKQAIGRGTRLFPGKTTCTVVDYNVKNIDILTKHAEARKEIYNELYPSLKEIEA